MKLQKISQISGCILILLMFVSERIKTFGAEAGPDYWNSLISRNSWSEFTSENRSNIVNLTNVTVLEDGSGVIAFNELEESPAGRAVLRQEDTLKLVAFIAENLLRKSEIFGLEIQDAAPNEWATLGQQLTNIVSLRVTYTSTALPNDFFSAVTNFSNLKYLHLQCREILEISSEINTLTNLTELQYLGLDAPAATNLNSGIYSNESLKELFLVAGSVDIPDGISTLPELNRVEIWGKTDRWIQSLPSDLSESTVEHLGFLNVQNFERLSPVLPAGLIELNISGCRLNTFTEDWSKFQKLKVLDLISNELESFPFEIFGSSSLEYIRLDFNRITNVPAIGIPDDRPVKIDLFENPIEHFAPENDSHADRGIIER